MALTFNNLWLPLFILLQSITQIFCHGQTQTVDPSKMRYIIFTEQCFHTFFSEFNFFHQECVKFTVAKLLGCCIIIGAAIVKLPQVIKILQKKSTFGVSFESVVLEQVTMISAIAYNVYRQNPFTVYGETVLIYLQMMLIHVFFIFFDPVNRNKAILMFPLIFGFFFAGYFPQYGLFPEYILKNTIIFQMIVITGSRFAQIYEIHKLKTTGNISIITYGLAVIGNLARVFTSLVQVKDDYLLIASYVQALALNSYIVLCFFIFKEPKKKEGQIKKE